MSKRKISVIAMISIVLNIALIWFGFSFYQENKTIKKGIITQYSTQQEEALFELERALENQDDKEEFVKALTSAYGIIYHNEVLTRTYTPIGENVEIPENINIINSPYTSKAIGNALFERTMDRMDNDDMQKLEEYTSYVDDVVKTLDYRNTIEEKSLSQQYKVLNEVSNLIEGFDLED
ncbi:hypothetical protein [Gracilibacillus sp. YIM 98692]|uniref:hypothetical protein n=1 Tax=Gracilibacillus sp. YIM 98692 TaxID=2663532 RepID=UPI0013D12EB7|nr:hypothetical protein [Gracilibacillus sp. YIM 98692]